MICLYYAGIGSRKTPIPILKVFNYLGEFLAQNGFTLRSGRAEGADIAFEDGCDRVGGNKQIYLPWKGFNKSKSELILPSPIPPNVLSVSSRNHPNWMYLSDTVKKLICRDAYQVLGEDLSIPSDFVVCYTPGGSGSGGTGQAIRIANNYNIPVFDFGKFSDLHEAEQNFNIFYKNIITKKRVEK